MNNPGVYITTDFLRAVDELPKIIRKRCATFIDQLGTDWRAKHLRIKPLHNMADPRLRTGQVDHNYRAVMVYIESPLSFILIHVDSHDDGNKFAETHRHAVNPFTGALQVTDLNLVQTVKGQIDELRVQQSSPVLDEALPLSYLSDEQIMMTGVPEVLVKSVREIRNDDELQRWQTVLGTRTVEALQYVMIGTSLQEALDVAGIAKLEGDVDVNDFGAALLNPNTRQTTMLVDNPEELQAILNEPLQSWRVFLHPEQEKYVKRHYTGPARLLGGAGTGKTVVAMHRARYLAGTICTTPSDRILFTTYTTTLAADIAQTMDSFCGNETRPRIDVINLHQWALTFLNEQRLMGGLPSVRYPNEFEQEQCWQTAIAAWPEMPATFYKRELSRVIAPQMVTTREQYLQADRIGQGLALNRIQRGKIWQVIEKYWAELASIHRMEWDQILSEVTLRLEESTLRPFRAVIVDEAQDWGVTELRLLRAMVRPQDNDLFFVGDGHQRIYGRPVPFSRCGIEIRGRSGKLTINYRTTEKIRRWSMSVLEGLHIDDLDGGIDVHSNYRSLRVGIPPDFHFFESVIDEARFVAGEISTLLELGEAKAEGICVAARTNDYLQAFSRLLKDSAITIYLLKNDKGDDESSGVRLATMHRIKGLEFQYVFLVGMNYGLVPPVFASSGIDTTERAAELARERCLLHVAATRARDGLTVTASGPPSPFLSGHL